MYCYDRGTKNYDSNGNLRNPKTQVKVLFTERQREFKKARPLTGFMCTTVKLLYILLGSVISKVYDKRFAIFIFIRPMIENSGSNFYPVYGRPLSIMAQSIPSVPIDPPPPPPRICRAFVTWSVPAVGDCQKTSAQGCGICQFF